MQQIARRLVVVALWRLGWLERRQAVEAGPRQDPSEGGARYADERRDAREGPALAS